MSADARYIATEQQSNIFVFDRISGKSTLVSVDSSGVGAGNGLSFFPTLSKDGRLVLFKSQATNLVSGFAFPTDSSGQVIPQVYVRDTQTGVTELISVDPTGTAVANQEFESNFNYAFSGNGQYVVFVSPATNLVSGINYVGGSNVFVRNLATHTTELVSISADGLSAGINGAVSPLGVTHDSFGAAISDDGRYVSFVSLAWNLVNGVTYVATGSNVFQRDRVAQTTMLLSVSPDGTQASDGSCDVQVSQDGSSSRYMSADGSVVAFSSKATNLVAPGLSGAAFQTNIYLRDRSESSPVLVSAAFDNTPANDSSGAAALSADGGYVVFTSPATNLVADNIGYFTIGHGLGGPLVANIYRWTRSTGSTEIVSLSSDKTTGADFDTQFPTISDDGQVVAFSGDATDLVVSPEVPLTFDEDQDSVYRWDAVSKQVSLASQQNDRSLGFIRPNFLMSGDGSLVVFVSNFGLPPFFITF
jgi:hypothetical protein